MDNNRPTSEWRAPTGPISDVDPQANVARIEAAIGRTPRTWRECLTEWSRRLQRTAMGYTFYDDGTVSFNRAFGARPRARVLDVNYFDARHRRSLAGRSLAAGLTGGLSLAASQYAGEIVLTLVTDRWSATVRPKQNGPIEKLHAFALQAKHH